MIVSKEIPGFPQDLSIQYVSSHENYAFDEEEHAALHPQAYVTAIVQEKIMALNEEILKLEDRLGNDDSDVEIIANRLAELCDTQEELESSSARETQQTLEDLGFEKFLNQPVAQLSCGWRFKCRLAAAFSSHPDVLILDEPSFLDATSSAWLIQKCKEMADIANAMVIIISHKEALLDNLCDRILYINSANNTMSFFNCSYGAFRSTHEANVEYAERTLEVFDTKMHTAESSLGHLKDQLNRREKNFKKIISHNADKRFVKGKSKESKQNADRSSASKLKQLKNGVEEMEEVKRQALREQAKQLKMEGYCSDSTLIVFEDVTFSYSNNSPPIIQYFDARIEATDRILLCGPNGCGKSTFLQLIIGDLEPKDGNIIREFDALYFPQTALIELIMKHGHEIVIAFLSDNMTQTDARQHLGEFGIADIALRPIAALSAGQRVRLWLAKRQLGSRRPSLLILDEVSENMDYDSRNVLLDILNTFAGAVIVVSHDEDFCAAFHPTQIWTMRSFGQFPVRHVGTNN